jgi:hypothetical protein
MGHFAPIGWNRPVVGGLVTEPLGAYGPAEAERIAGRTTLSVISPAFPLGAGASELRQRYGDERAISAAPFFSAGLDEQTERKYPVLLSAVRVAAVPAALTGLASRAVSVAVRDADSRDRLQAAGVERDIAVIPHPALLLGKAVGFETLPVRRQQLRKLGELPADGDYVVLAASGHVPPAPAIDSVPPVIEHMPPASVIEKVLAAAGADHLVVLQDGMPNGGLNGLPGAHVTVPDLVLEERLAVLHGARLAIVTDEHGAAAAAGLGTPWVLVDIAGAHRPAVAGFGDPSQLAGSFEALPAAAPAALGLPAHTPEAAGVLSAHFDRMAELAEHALAEAGGDPPRTAAELAAENRALRHAMSRLRERQLVERERLTESLTNNFTGGVAGELTGLRAHNSELEMTAEQLAARLRECERELDAWQQTKLVRWTKPLRQAYGRWLSR